MKTRTLIVIAVLISISGCFRKNGTSQPGTDPQESARAPASDKGTRYQAAHSKPGSEPQEKEFQPPAAGKRHPGCWQMADVDVIVPLDREVRRMLVKCFEQENWIMDQSALTSLPKGLRIERETEKLADGTYIKYFLIGSTLDDAKYVELLFKPNDAAGINAKSDSLTFRIQSGNPKTFSDECAVSDSIPTYETQVRAPIDYQIALCNADEGRDLAVSVEPKLPEGVEVQTRRVRPNRVLLSLAGKAAKGSHEVYKFRILRGPIQLNPLSMELLVQDPSTKAEEIKVVEQKPTAQDVSEQKHATLIVTLAGYGDVYIDQKKVSVPYQLELDAEEHSVQVMNGARVEFSRKIPKLESYKGPTTDIWNIVTTGSVAGYGYQADREAMAARVMEIRRRALLEKTKGRSVASTVQVSGGGERAAPNDRMTLREMDVVVEMKVLKQMVLDLRERVIK